MTVISRTQIDFNSIGDSKSRNQFQRLKLESGYTDNSKAIIPQPSKKLIQIQSCLENIYRKKKPQENSRLSDEVGSYERASRRLAQEGTVLGSQQDDHRQW